MQSEATHSFCRLKLWQCLLLVFMAGASTLADKHTMSEWSRSGYAMRESSGVVAHLVVFGLILPLVVALLVGTLNSRSRSSFLLGLWFCSGVMFILAAFGGKGAVWVPL
jgi:hypothetical protein